MVENDNFIAFGTFNDEKDEDKDNLAKSIIW